MLCVALARTLSGGSVPIGAIVRAFYVAIYIRWNMDIFGRFTVTIGEALAYFFKHPFGYRHVMDGGAATDLTKGNVFG